MSQNQYTINSNTKLEVKKTFTIASDVLVTAGASACVGFEKRTYVLNDADYISMEDKKFDFFVLNLSCADGTTERIKRFVWKDDSPFTLFKGTFGLRGSTETTSYNQLNVSYKLFQLIGDLCYWAGIDDWLDLIRQAKWPVPTEKLGKLTYEDVLKVLFPMIHKAMEGWQLQGQWQLPTVKTPEGRELKPLAEGKDRRFLNWTCNHDRLINYEKEVMTPPDRFQELCEQFLSDNGMSVHVTD